MDKITYYCQKCRAANEPGEANCWRCGTRLMLIVFPPSVRHDGGNMPSYYEDHLLERVSLLELRLAQVMEQMASAYEFIQREVKSFHKDHVLLQSFFETLERVNPDLSELLSRECMELYEGKKAENEAVNSIDRELEIIFGQDGGRQPELFAHLISEGLKLLAENEEKLAFQMFEHAVLLSPENGPLLTFIAKRQFKAEKFREAKESLEKAHELAPEDSGVRLMLGACFGDEGDSEKAKKLVGGLANNQKMRLCVNYIWGILAAVSKNWLESLAAFKECITFESSPEINYLTGCVYFELGRRKSALRYLKAAVAADPRFADAWFMQSLIFRGLDNEEKAAECRRAAFDSREAGAQCIEFFKGKDIREPERPLPFLHFPDKDKRILTGGSLRLSKFIREQVIRAID